MCSLKACVKQELAMTGQASNTATWELYSPQHDMLSVLQHA